MLQSSPLAAGSTQITSTISTNFVVNGGEGVQTINLRGLGDNRTLVLLNGRRAGPAGVRGGVSAFDLNVIPLDAIQSIDILKTGASSIYGSDAIAGVVNLITKKDLRGLEVRGFVSVPDTGGGEQYSISAPMVGALAIAATPWSVSTGQPPKGTGARRPQLPWLRRRECDQRGDRRARRPDRSAHGRVLLRRFPEQS